jgi:hypothetical protein
VKDEVIERRLSGSIEKPPQPIATICVSQPRRFLRDSREGISSGRTVDELEGAVPLL